MKTETKDKKPKTKKTKAKKVKKLTRRCVPENQDVFESVKDVIEVYAEFRMAVSKTPYFVPKDLRKGLRYWNQFYSLALYLRKYGVPAKFYMQCIFTEYPRIKNNLVAYPLPSQLLSLDYLCYMHILRCGEIFGSSFGLANLEDGHKKEIGRGVLNLKRLLVSSKIDGNDCNEYDILLKYTTFFTPFFILTNHQIFSEINSSIPEIKSALNQHYKDIKTSSEYLRRSTLQHISFMSYRTRIEEYIDRFVEANKMVYYSNPLAMLQKMQHELEEINYSV